MISSHQGAIATVCYDREKNIILFFPLEKWHKYQWYTTHSNGTNYSKVLEIEQQIVNKRLYYLLTIFSRKILLA